MTRLIIPLLILFALAGTAHAIGLGQLGARFGGLGSIGKKGTAAPPPSTCSGTGLIFNIPCNSQYVPIL